MKKTQQLIKECTIDANGKLYLKIVGFRTQN
jgi:hypothetical protein